jgi:hypothetical protein
MWSWLKKKEVWEVCVELALTTNLAAEWLRLGIRGRTMRTWAPRRANKATLNASV